VNILRGEPLRLPCDVTPRDWCEVQALGSLGLRVACQQELTRSAVVLSTASETELRHFLMRRIGIGPLTIAAIEAIEAEGVTP
jgi:hypothetical protein